jgi:hypothetical protein
MEQVSPLRAEIASQANQGPLLAAPFAGGGALLASRDEILIGLKS